MDLFFNLDFFYKNLKSSLKDFIKKNYLFLFYTLLFFFFNFLFGIVLYSINLTIFYPNTTTNTIILDNLQHNQIDFPVFVYFGLFYFSLVLVSAFFYSYLSFYGIFILNIVGLYFLWYTLLFSIWDLFYNNKVYLIYFGKWVLFNVNVRLDFYFIIDIVSFSFLLLTTSIALFVYLYAFSYFRYEPLVDKFILFISFFVVSMLFLVLSGNTIMLFLGWEMIGLTSFFLINFWTTKLGTLKAAFKAFTFNKISDFWLLFFIIISYNLYYDFDILNINNQTYLYCNSFVKLFNYNISYIEFLCFTLISSAFIKSAQFGSHTWLPDSMEAPVPASSLIHSATLVSAGVFLVLRFNAIFDYSMYVKYLLPIIGSFTAAYGGLLAAHQSDTKRTLAYSTISHCGFLIVLCFTQVNEFVILYLYVHGFFKAAVFMCVGNVIRISRGYQDFRKMGLLWKYLPFEFFAIFVILFNLAGLPFTVGFLIKHILFLGLYDYVYLYYFVLFNCLVGAFSGLFYSYRLFYNIFFDFKKGGINHYNTFFKANLNSLFYSNTSLASNVSIFLLIVVSYSISYIFIGFFLNAGFLSNDCYNINVFTTYFSSFNSYFGHIINFSIINVIVCFFIIILIYSQWRFVNNFSQNLNSFLFLFLLFYIFLLTI